MIAGLWCSSIRHRPHKLLCLWPLTCFRSTFGCFFPFCFPILFIYFTSSHYPCYCWPSPSLWALAEDILECRYPPLQIHGMWPWIHLVFRLYSFFLVLIIYVHNTYKLFFRYVCFFPFTSILPCLISFTVYFISMIHLKLLYIDYTTLCYAAQCCSLYILFILVLILTRLSVTALPCGISFSLGLVANSSSLPVGRRVSRGPCRASAGARGQRWPAACWRYRATSTTAYRFWTLLARASWMSKHHLAQWLQQVVLFISKGQLHFFRVFCFFVVSSHMGSGDLLGLVGVITIIRLVRVVRAHIESSATKATVLGIIKFNPKPLKQSSTPEHFDQHVTLMLLLEPKLMKFCKCS